MDEAERSRRVDTLNYQIRELERAELRPGEDEELDQRRTLLRSAGRLMEAVQGADFALSGGEDSQGACDLIGDAEASIRGAARYSEQLEELARTLAELRSAAQDAAERVKDLGQAFEFSPQELDQLESRLDVLYRLKKKYGSTVDEMLSYLERCRRELEEIQDADDTIVRLEEKLSRARSRARERGEALSAARKAAAEALQARVQEELYIYY